ncbi:MAG: hypothetical protein Q4F57_05680 [Weeksellaceae bacterium]|nr:hypothetical protein [Weeksellaceae bacterium]
MNRMFFHAFLLLGTLAFAQVPMDSLFIRLNFSEDLNTMYVQQEIILLQDTKTTSFEFHAYANAYDSRETPLSKKLLTYRNDRLHFAPLSERGRIRDLIITNSIGDTINPEWLHSERFRINTFQQEIPQGVYHLKYTIDLPNQSFTGYGATDDKARLRYFFIHPVRYTDEKHQHYIGLDILQHAPTFYYIDSEQKNGVYIYADLPQKENNIFMGSVNYHPELIITKESYHNNLFTPAGNVFRAFPDPGHTPAAYRQAATTKTLDYLQEFFQETTPEIMLSREFVRDHYLDGIDDVELPFRRRIRIFPQLVRSELEQITPLTHKLAQQHIGVDLEQEHWLRNGLAEYIHQRFLLQEHPQALIVGQLPQRISLWRIKPLNFFQAATIPLHQRNQLIYRYFQLQRLDEAIETPFSQLGKMNQLVVSQYKAGLAFRFLGRYVGEDLFDEHVAQTISNNRLQTIYSNEFLESLSQKSGKNLDWFTDEMLTTSRNKDFKISSVKILADSIQIRIKNKSRSQIPILLTAKQQDSIVHRQWVYMPQKSGTVIIPKVDFDEISLNEDLHIDEVKIYNNYYRPGTLFNRKLRIGFFGDTESVEHYQLFLVPGLGWNLYDRWQIGMTVTNETVMPQDLSWTFTPAYSTGTGRITGGGGIRYNWYPEGTIFRRISPQAGAVYRHYDRDLAFSKWVLASSFEFRRSPADLIYKSLSLGYEQIHRQVRADATAEQLKLQNYNLLQARFNFWRTDILDERRANINFQHSNHFNKVFAETFHRLKLSPGRIVGIRLFAGYFLSHDIRESQFFDFGLDRISDYTFSYNLLGRSETEGLFSQQFVIAEGAFKSNFGVFANQLMATTNLEYPLWSFMDLYADAGIYKNHGHNLQFVYGTGVRLRVIPDFLEFYLPIQSSLGFEPTLPEYHKRIRFMFSFNLSRVIAFWRRGKF